MTALVRQSKSDEARLHLRGAEAADHAFDANVARAMRQKVRMRVIGFLRRCEKISCWNCSRHTPCAVRDLRHTACAYYIQHPVGNCLATR